MFRLGTRPASMRTSWPLELMMSSFSPESEYTELGTSLMSSTRRSAVTVTVPKVPGAAGEALCASAPVLTPPRPTEPIRPMQTARVCATGRSGRASGLRRADGG